MTDLATTGFGYDDGDIDANRTANTSLNELIAERYSRRQALRGGASAAAMAVFGGSMLAACGGNGDGDTPSDPAPTVTISGGNVTVTTGTRVTLTATATDNGSIAETQFVQVSGPLVSLSATSGTTTSFLAPATPAQTTVVIRYRAKDNAGKEGTAEANITVNPAVLSFTAVTKNKLDIVTLPAGYTASILYRLGDPLTTAAAAYGNVGADADFASRAGDHHGALRYFGLEATGAGRDELSSTRGLLVMNHERITQAYLHPAGPTAPGGARPEGEVLKEIEAHGVSVVEVTRSSANAWSYAQGSTLNFRVTPNTAVAINGPARGAALLQTAFSADGTAGRGTIGNSASSATPWGTSLTSEGGWASYFRRPAAADDARRSAKDVASLARYGVTSDTGSFGWATVRPADASDTRYRRWDAQATGGSAQADFRNEPYQFGWVVEVDPFDKTTQSRKRTALGRLNHNGCVPGVFFAGRKPAWYLSDQGQNEYLYKFVSDTAWDTKDASATDRLAVGDKYLDKGTLYVAQFAEDGTGKWLPLKFGESKLTTGNAAYPFADQADVLANLRFAGDAEGGTPMDRPGWTAVQPISGEIYLALNGNDARTSANANAANPRSYRDAPSPTLGNRNGHIIRLVETGGTGEAVTFNWDIYLFGAGADLDAANVNVSALEATNDFSGPRGLGFARPSNPSGQATPLGYIQTDDAAFTDQTNNQMLITIPGTTGDAGTSAEKTISNADAAGTVTTIKTRAGKAATAALVKRFLVGPVECAVTGVDTSPDGTALFVNIQHPGLNGTAATPTSNWPASQTAAAPGSRPRSATIVIQRTDGGVIGL